MATVRGRYDVDFDKSPKDEINASYLLVSCERCGSAQLLGVDIFDAEDDLLQVVWPKSSTGDLNAAIPGPLIREMRQAHSCFKTKAYTAAAVMVRRTLEGLCAEQGTTPKKPLFNGLKELRDSGKIEGRLFDWAQALRVIGNQGAHFSTTAVTREDAADALALAEALLDYVYVFTARYAEFEQRRASKSANTSPNADT
ncbi:DUF4145 domain-containing protein [Streptomyces sp. NPDC047070]|uniref:DUF4145 domain-containing protein n=1 Tax=Streptomyces sp. NPDC047070 TaxID=3154923 RepID=UPI0034547EB6